VKYIIKDADAVKVVRLRCFCRHYFWSRCRLEWCSSGEISDLGLPDWTMAIHGVIFSLWGIFLEQLLARGGYSGSWRRGAAEVRWRLCFVLHAQGGGTVCRRGGVDSDSDENLRFGLTPWIWVRGERERWR
jgi:hypothetical protein